VARAYSVILNRDDRASARQARFLDLVEQHRARALSIAWRLLGGSDAAAEDVVQEAFLRAHRALGGFRDDSKIETWFFRILMRQISNYRRWQKLKTWWPLESQEILADPNPTLQGDPGLRKRIVAAVSRLSHRQRSVFVLVHMEGFTVVETAAIIQCSVGTAKSHLHRALKSLRAELADLKDEKPVMEAT
jgi:RNA polymerase sigma-70 factor, ECF subfamily